MSQHALYRFARCGAALGILATALVPGACNRQPGPPGGGPSGAGPGESTGAPDKASTPDAGNPSNQRAASQPEASGQSIRVEDGAGAVLFVLQPSEKGFRVKSGDGRKLGAIKVQEDRMKVSDAAGKPAYKLKLKGGGFKLYREPEQAGGTDVEVARFESGDAGFRIKDPEGRVLYQGETRGPKVKVSGPEGRQWVVKEKGDGVEVEDASGAGLARVKGLKSVPAGVFGAAAEFDLLQKALVAAYATRVQL